MNEQYDFEEHLEFYKQLYMSEGFAESDAEEISLTLMRTCGVEVGPYYEEYARSRKAIH